MDPSDDSSVDGLLARRTVQDYNTFRYVLAHHPQSQLTVLTNVFSSESIVKVPDLSTLSELQRTAVLAKLQYESEKFLDCPRVKLT